MTAEAASTPEHEPGRPPYADASPARVRAALVPEDVPEFDRQWREAMAAATTSLDLSEVHRTLEAWRRVAWLVTARGHDGYRRLLAEAGRRTRTGERVAGSVPLEQVRALIAERRDRRGSSLMPGATSSGTSVRPFHDRKRPGVPLDVGDRRAV